jgi:hypothetical protein
MLAATLKLLAEIVVAVYRWGMKVWDRRQAARAARATT